MTSYLARSSTNSTPRARSAKLSSFRRKCSVALLGLLLFAPLFLPACAGTPEQLLSAEQFQLSSYPLPKTLKADEQIIIRHVPDRGTLIGSNSGLYYITGQGLLQNDIETVVAMAPWQNSYLLIARSDKLQIWDGAFHESDIYRKLNDEKVTALAAQANDTMWIGTEKALYLVKGTEVRSFEQFAGAQAIHTFLDATSAIVKGKDGSFKALSLAENGEVKMEDFSSSSNIPEQIITGKGGQIWGLTEGLLYHWTQQGSQNAWAAFGWSPKTTDGQPSKLTQLSVDAMTGKTWALTEHDVFQITPERVYRIERPSGIGKIRSIQAAEDALWLADEENLHKLSIVTGSEEIRYNGKVKAFMDANCLRCHGTSGPGRNLDSYAATKDIAVRIAEVIETGQMPPDKNTLVGGDANMIRRWIEGGTKE
ncbi:MAG: cytochrome c [Myxococcales bacterium]|nr:cytochrome c [Myxococcales bacterium]